MPAKRLTGGQYYIEVKVAEKTTARYVFDDKESYETALKCMIEDGEKITAQGEF